MSPEHPPAQVAARLVSDMLKYPRSPPTLLVSINTEDLKLRSDIAAARARAVTADIFSVLNISLIWQRVLHLKRVSVSAKETGGEGIS